MSMRTKMNSKHSVTGGVALALLTAFTLGYWISHARAAGVPKTPLTYSGVLTDMNGTVLSGSKSILLQLYGGATGGTALCASSPTPVTLVAGAFQVALADNCTDVIRSTADLWVEILVDGTSVGRAKLGAVPYAIEADHAATATSAHTAETATTIAAGTVAIPGNLKWINNDKNSLGPECKVFEGTVVDCTCPDGSFVVGGGGAADSSGGMYVRESRPLSVKTWRVACGNVATNKDMVCNTYSLLCSRIGP
jgi:hypothetical protein